jgi:hypothetical protein
VRESVSSGHLACDEGIRPLERRGVLMIPFARAQRSTGVKHLLAPICVLLYGCCIVKLSDPSPLALPQRQSFLFCLSADGNLTSCVP